MLESIKFRFSLLIELLLTGLWVGEEMEIGTSEESGIKSQ